MLLPGADLVVSEARTPSLGVELWKFFLHRTSDQNQSVTKIVVSALMAVIWLDALACLLGQEMVMPTPRQLRGLDLTSTGICSEKQVKKFESIKNS